MKKTLVFLLISSLILLFFLLHKANNQKTLPNSLTHYLESAIAEEHIFVITKVDTAYQIEDQNKRDTFFVSPNSAVDPEQYLNVPVTIQGEFEQVEHVSFGENQEFVSAAAVRLDKVEFAQR